MHKICLITGLCFFFLLSYADAGLPEFLAGQKEAIVGIDVKDGSGEALMEGFGLVVDSEGLVVTDSRVISKWLEDVQYDLTVRTEGGETLSLYRLIVYNPKLRIALFKVNARGLKAARLPAGDRVAGYIKRAIVRYKAMVRARGVVLPDEAAPDGGAFEVVPRRGTPEEPVDAESYYLKGLGYARLNRYAEAIDEYRKALMVRPDYVDAYIGLGLVYYKLDRYSDAIDAYNHALRLRPGLKSIYNKVGSIYLILGRYSEAIETFRAALGIEDRDPVLHFNLAIANFLKGDRDSAWREYVVLKGLDADLAERLKRLIH